MKIGDMFYAAWRPNGPAVRWRVITEPAEECGRGPLFVWAEPLPPWAGYKLPAEAVFYVRNIRAIGADRAGD